jgi:prevent-host-death family protein
MKRTAVSTLKATLSACLAKVKAGDEVLVMERGKPIAKLVPLAKDGDGGLVRVGSGKLPTGFWKLPRPKDRKRRALQALLAERAEAR